MTEHRRRRWEHAVEWPLTAAAVAFLVAYAWPILDTGLTAGASDLARLVTTVTWAFFALDYLVRLLLSVDRWGFVRANVLDLVVVALPLLRPLRLLRLLTLLTTLNRYAGGSLRGRVMVYVIGSASLVLLVAALAVLDAERGADGANLGTFGDALWWSLTTVTTVGYGDRFPVTPTGRAVAGGLMIAGIALLGTVTATLASWLVQRVAEVEQASEAATRRDVEALTAEVAALRADLRAVLSASSGSGALPPNAALPESPSSSSSSA